MTEEEKSVIEFIEARKNVLYFEEIVIAAFGALGERCLHLVQTEPSLRQLKTDIQKEKARFASLQAKQARSLR